MTASKLRWNSLWRTMRHCFKERTRNIIGEHVTGQQLDDSELPNATIFGNRVFTGHLYFQPSKEIEITTYQSKNNQITAGYEKSNEIVKEEFVAQKLRAQIIER